MGSEELNSHFHICFAGTLTTDPSPWGPCFYFKENYFLSNSKNPDISLSVLLPSLFLHFWNVSPFVIVVLFLITVEEGLYYWGREQIHWRGFTLDFLAVADYVSHSVNFFAPLWPSAHPNCFAVVQIAQNPGDSVDKWDRGGGNSSLRDLRMHFKCLHVFLL